MKRPKIWTMIVEAPDGLSQGWIVESYDPSSLFAWLEANYDVFKGNRITLKRTRKATL